MKIILYFTGKSKQNGELELEWDFPALPRPGELFDLDDFLPEDMDEDFFGLSWEIDFVSWRKIKDDIVYLMYLFNEFEQKLSNK